MSLNPKLHENMASCVVDRIGVGGRSRRRRKNYVGLRWADNHGPRSQSTSMLDLHWPSKHNSGILLSRNENVAKLCLYFDVDPSDWGEDE